MGQRKTKPTNRIFADALIERRAKLGWTLAKTAEYLGLSTRGYLKYEDNDSAPLAVMQEGILMRLDKMITAGSCSPEKKSEPGKTKKRK